MNFEELVLKNIVWIIGILVHALYTYFRVNQLEKKQQEDEILCEKRFTQLETRMENDVNGLTREKNELIAEIAKLRETISNMDAKLDILLVGYKKEKR